MSASQLGAPHILEESPQDSVYPIANVREGRIGEPPSDFWGFLIENYINQECALDISLREGPFCDSGKLSAPQCRVLLYWPGFHAFQHSVAERSKGFWKRETVLTDYAPREMEGAMLVSVREFTEMQERAIPTLPCAAVCFRERLLRADHVDMASVEPWDKFSSYVTPKICLRHVDRELNFPWIPFGWFQWNSL